MGHRRAAVASPVPIRAAVERIGEPANFALIGAVAGEIRRGGQHARQQEGRVDRRKLAVPDAPSVDHIEKMIVETLVARRVGVRALNAAVKKPQGREGSLDGERATDETALHADRIGGEGEAHRRDARRGSRLILVRDQSVARVCLMNEIIERLALQRVHELRTEPTVGHVNRGLLAGRTAGWRWSALATCEDLRQNGACTLPSVGVSCDRRRVSDILIFVGPAER